MAQQVFDKSWPLGKNGASELIPGGAILQTRDGKDEPITLSASFQLGEGGLFLPTDKDNPLEVRVRELEKLIGEIATSPAANTVQARLKTLADRLGEAVAEPDEHTLLARIAQLEIELSEIKGVLTDGTQKVTLTGQIEVLAEISTTTNIPANSVLELVPRGLHGHFRELRASVYMQAETSTGSFTVRLRLLQPHSDFNAPFGYAELVTINNGYRGYGRTQEIVSPRWCVEIVNQNDFEATLVSAVVMGVKG